MAKVDWLAIKNEYISTDISQRRLAEKHGVSYNTLKDKANKEKWAADKEKQHIKITSKTHQKTAEKIAENEASRVAGLVDLAEDAQEKIAIALGQLDKQVDMFGKVHSCEVLDVARLRKLVAALKDLKDIIGVDDGEDDKDDGGVIVLPDIKD